MNGTILTACGALAVALACAPAGAGAVERWGRFEWTGQARKTHKNPFTDVELSCTFTRGDEKVTVAGFCDGPKTYRIRFMPSTEGAWSFRTQSNDPGLDGRTGSFECGPAGEGNHGPVVVRNKTHFAYADGSPYFQIGTTCYAWAHQGDAMEARTLATLRDAPFNKMRMCVFPKSYTYNQNEPKHYPFEGKPLKKWDFTRFNPAFWRHFERRVEDLMNLGIEADLILFHPYDRWGFKSMSREADDRYLRYAVARLAAYRNVWWSLANEYDLMLKIPSKKMTDWDRFFRILAESDPYGHWRGIHNCRGWYDHNKKYVTHASIQSSDFRVAAELPGRYHKPCIYDECKYEGNIPQGWGNISAREMVHRFWMGTCSGCYVGHGETYKHPKDILWWSKGSVLHGQSPPRIALLKKLMQAEPYEKMVPDRKLSPGNYVLAQPGQRYLVYCLGAGASTIALPAGKAFKVDGIDTWEMTVTPRGTARGPKYAFTPPKAPYLLRLAAYAPGEPLRPEATLAADVTEGVAPLKVTFTGGGGKTYRWDFGDGSTGRGARAVHTFAKPGLYTVSLTAKAAGGTEGVASVMIGVEVPGAGAKPIVRVGFPDGDTPAVTCHGKVRRGKDGSFDLGRAEPWKWVTVGVKPMAALEGLRSLTVLGWARAESLQTGMGGNRIAFNLNYSRNGIDLVQLDNGRLRLAVNEWPDRVRNDSSDGKIVAGKWVFFAVTYDATKRSNNVRWYFGDEIASASRDRTTSYDRGPTGTDSGPLTIGNYNETIHRHGTDRQFRGQLRAVMIFGSRVGSGGALNVAAIRKAQSQSHPGGKTGVIVLDRNRCDGAYRLLSSRQKETARVVDLDGRVVHRWAYEQGLTWHYAEMLPDGHLVAIAKDHMILEVDFRSRLVWKCPLRAHHDFARLKNGNTLVVSRRDLTNPWTNKGKLTCDVLVEVTKANEVVWQWKVEAHAGELAKLVKLQLPPSEKFWDFPHVNTLEILPDSPAARKDRRFREGNLLVCGRHIDTIWVIDRETDRVVWAWGPGELLGPHMPTMLPNGHILVYDNGQNAETGVRGWTRVLEIEPISGKIVWQYRAKPPEHFYSPSRGSNERLANGNTLIAESDSGRVFEVTPAGQIVWDLVNPERRKSGRPMALYRVGQVARDRVDGLVKAGGK